LNPYVLKRSWWLTCGLRPIRHQRIVPMQRVRSRVVVCVKRVVAVFHRMRQSVVDTSHEPSTTIGFIHASRVARTDS